jgi:hypothetical protein
LLFDHKIVSASGASRSFTRGWLEIDFKSIVKNIAHHVITAFAAVDVAVFVNVQSGHACIALPS